MTTSSCSSGRRRPTSTCSPCAARSTRMFPGARIDPATMAADSAVAIDWFHPSPDGSLVAYGLSEGGTENSVLHVLDVATGAVHADLIHNTRAASVAWLPDNTGFWYSVYPPGRRVQPPRSASIAWAPTRPPTRSCSIASPTPRELARRHRLARWASRPGARRWSVDPDRRPPPRHGQRRRGRP